jgi:hypothetical protein
MELCELLRAAAGVDVAGLLELAAKAIYDSWYPQPGFVAWVPGGNSHKQTEARDIASAALESTLRLVLAQRVPPGCVVVPVERLTVEEIKTLRQQVRNDPRCQDEHWFVLMARAIEDRYLAAALTDQSQKKESP